FHSLAVGSRRLGVIVTRGCGLLCIRAPAIPVPGAACLCTSSAEAVGARPSSPAAPPPPAQTSAPDPAPRRPRHRRQGGEFGRAELFRRIPALAVHGPAYAMTGR